MKTALQNNFLVTELSMKDILQIIKNIEYEHTDDFLSVFKTVIKDFSEWENYVQQELIMMLVKQHVKKATAEEIEFLLINNRKS